MASSSSAADAGARQRHAAASAREVGERLVRARDVALADAGALDDPLVGGVERLAEVGVGDDPGGDGDAEAAGRPRWERGSCAARGDGRELGADVLAQADLGRLDRDADGVLDRVG